MTLPSTIGRRRLLAGLLAAPFASRPSLATADDWQPSRPIRVLRGFAPGTMGDAVMHRLAEGMTERLGQPVVIESRPGAGGNIAMDALAKSAPDGHTLGLTAMGPVVTNPILMGGRMPYDAERAFTPLFRISEQPVVAMVHLSVPAAGRDFVDWLRRHPDTAYGSVGIGSTHHLVGAMLSHALGLSLRHVPYRGAPLALTDLLAGRILLSFDLIGGAAGAIRDGQVRAVAVTTERRSPLFPEVPTFAEIGLPQVAASSWLGLFAPAGLPPAVARRLTDALDAIVHEPAFAAWLAGLGATPVGGDAAEFAAFLAAERVRWAAVIRVAGIALD
ncbi:Bug family tripartite tricarboxylate transporter substrate binding protein [Stella sp.]|uniref:Bug family tripartite tricarboxylate transporter substrate binding protein n=1 Tax=Stella sp. TaxID=2912054 RepID=UPI0035B0123D